MNQYFYYPSEGFVKTHVEQFANNHIITYTSLNGKEVYKGEFPGTFRGERSIGVPFFDTVKDAFIHEMKNRKKIFDLYRVNGQLKKGIMSARSTPEVIGAYISARLKGVK